ncbi:RagB/SusD family nutrient uptake outer membrane protein [Siphonobacter curvatus]|uniref:RagB/SusD family nutrient uptake outer membrane protein n=1 Tax=Siphonobacter curvatus TaxID=2094562 RepID=A0A2S7IHR9_9BACT|nr:RagB/SusD family nutrient uptake outer membrane protein [Siphonobacter curvatus]PQA55628.1 RagB/SusD family nutrient uptake outer membrane protein [Siphonobacter curvatus]
MKKIHIALVALVLSSTSCKDALKETPYDFVGPDQVGTTTEADAKLWVNGVLNTLNSGSFFQYAVYNRPLEVDADDVTGKDYAFQAMGAGNFQSTSDINTFWGGPYTLIERCNFAITKVSQITIDDASKNNALGQLYFLRGWAYYMLVRAYGPIPIFKKSVTEGENTNQPRASVPDVYAHIIENLKMAETMLYTRTNARYETGRLSQEAAKTLLAKVYVTMASGALKGAQVTVLGGRQRETVNGVVRRIQPTATTYTKSVVAGHESFDAAQYFKLARDKAKEVIDMQKAGSPIDLFPRYMDTWAIGNRNKGEHLWQMNAITGSEIFGNFLSYHYVGYLMANGSIDGALYAMSDHWYELFEEKDQRITEGVQHRWRMFSNAAWHYYPAKDSLKVKNSGTVPTAEGYQPTDVYSADQFHTAKLSKYAQVSDRTVQRSDMPFPFLRYAETLLIFAEAENEVNGPTADAYEALNKVRRRSGASDAANLNQQQLRSFILQERQRELALEGHRAWDIRRWGIYLQVMNAIDIDANNIIKRRQEKHLLLPLPLNEINGNTAINENNPGW